jgi:hypothetical protein
MLHEICYLVDGVDADINTALFRAVQLNSISRDRPGRSKRTCLLSQVTLRRNKVPAATGKLRLVAPLHPFQRLIRFIDGT